jgi:hypothetical protein
MAQLLDWNVKSLSLWHCHFFNKGLMGAYWPGTHHLKPHAGTRPPLSEKRRLRAKAQPGSQGIVTRNEEPLAGAAWELGQVGKKSNHLLSTYYKPGAQATVDLHLYQVTALKARTHHLEGRGHGDSWAGGQGGLPGGKGTWVEMMKDDGRYKKGKENCEKGHIEIRRRKMLKGGRTQKGERVDYKVKEERSQKTQPGR